MPFLSLVKRNLNIDASTRSSAVLRIGLVFLAWSCFANRLIVYRTFQSPDWFFGLMFYIFWNALYWMENQVFQCWGSLA